MKRTAHRLSIMAYMISLVAVMGQKTAEKEIARKRDHWTGHSHSTRRNPGAFGGPKRAGVKLIRKSVRSSVKLGGHK